MCWLLSLSRRLGSAVLLVVMLMGMKIHKSCMTAEVAEIEGGTGTAVASVTVCHLSVILVRYVSGMLKASCGSVYAIVCLNLVVRTNFRYSGRS